MTQHDNTAETDQIMMLGDRLIATFSCQNEIVIARVFVRAAATLPG